MKVVSSGGIEGAREGGSKVNGVEEQEVRRGFKIETTKESEEKTRKEVPR